MQTTADWGTYVCAHVDSVEGIQRAIRAGVRSIEHGHLVDEERSDEMARKNAWLSLQPFDKGDNPSRRNSSEGRTHVPLGPCGAVGQGARGRVGGPVGGGRQPAREHGCKPRCRKFRIGTRH